MLVGWQRPGLRAGGGTRPHPNLLANRLADHRQNLIRNLKHVVCGTQVVRKFGDYFLFANPACLKLTPRDQIVAVQDFCHDVSTGASEESKVGAENAMWHTVWCQWYLTDFFGHASPH